jgi:fumarate hydratase class II
MTHETLARATTPRGEVVLRRDEAGVLELRVNGVFVMDTARVATEEALAAVVLDRLADPGRVVVGGLGLGFTVRRLLADQRVREIVVAEIEPPVAEWMRDGTVPHGPAIMSDSRLRLEVADVREVLAAEPAHTLDAVLLDVDNGPDGLVHDANSAVYDPAFLDMCASRLRPHGWLGIWSATASTALESALRDTIGACERVPYAVDLDGRPEEYSVYVACTSPQRQPFRVASLPGMSEDDTASHRIERDTMGEVKVPANALWRAQTQRAVENFPISGIRLERDHIWALAQVKGAAAQANAELGVLPQDIADAIRESAREVADGAYDDHFPIDVFQTGSGTSSNMNTNEVLASLATQRLGRDVHPNDHVNASQSSNDVFPTSIHVAATAAVTRELIPALVHLSDALGRKATEFESVVKSGRTHLMDATPVTLGQEFGGYATQVRRGIARVESALPRVSELPLGGTAVGTGINTPPAFAGRVIEILGHDTGLALTEAADHFEAQGARDGLVELSGQLRTIAVGLTKICNDIRWMGSGPTTGLAEIALPDLQPGSSIMPGKVNPVLAEATLMVCAQVIGNDVAITTAGASGNFELNVMMPVMAHCLLESIRLLANASRLFADRCIDGITANVEQARAYAESSPSIVTPLNRLIGYEAAAKIAKQAVAEGRTIREVVIDQGYVARGDLTEEQLDKALDVMRMTRP